MHSARPFRRGVVELRRSHRSRLTGEALESRAMLSVSNDDPDLLARSATVHNHSGMCGCPGCSFGPPPAANQAAVFQASAASYPLADTFKLHSLPTATKRIYLDFDGHFTTNTLWQTYFRYGDIDTPAFSLDANYLSFSDAEKAYIQEIWARTAEDFAPFDVNVTTEDPGVDALVNSGPNDTAWGVRVVIGGNGTWLGGAAGVAVFEGFGQSDGSPAFAFADQWWKTNPNIVTGCISHEVGHTLGLSHDGPGYYGGHGSGPTGWGPIMGNPDKGLTQWSKGEYGSANNKEDDLAIITTQNGFGYRADDHGGTTAAATPIVAGTTVGIIEQNTDVDLFRFSASGSVKALVKPAAFGPNLDILAELLDANGAVIETSSPLNALDASFAKTLAAGTYYLRVQGTGEGDPLGTGYTKYGSLGQYTISLETDAPPPPPASALSISDLTVVEGNSGPTSGYVTIRISQAPTQPVTVKWAPKAGTATAGTDYSFPTTGGTLTFSPGGLTEQQIDVVVTGDTAVEPDETFSITLSDAVGAMIADGEGVITITNDDVGPPPPPSLVIGDSAITEGNSGTLEAVFIVKLTSPAAAVTTVAYKTKDASATVTGGDYVATTGTLTFQPGESVKEIRVPVKGDTSVEPDETFLVLLSNPSGATISDESAIGTILNDDAPPPSLAIGDSAITEGNSGTSDAVFTVKLTSPATAVTTVAYKTKDASATVAGGDYVATTGTLTFQPGESVQEIRVPVKGDTAFEPNETFLLLLSNPTGGATISDESAVGTILNDDAEPPPLTLTAQGARVVEGTGGTSIARIPITLNRPASKTIAFRYSTQAGSATAGGDFSSTSGIIYVAAGRTSVDVPIAIVADSTPEADEVFNVTLMSTDARVLTPQVSVTIINDDRLQAPPTPRISNTSVIEGNAGNASLVFRITLAQPATETITLGFRTVDGTALKGRDYVTRTGTITFLRGRSEAVVVVSVISNRLVDGDRSLRLEVFDSKSPQTVLASATGTIRDDDRLTTSRPTVPPGTLAAAFAAYSR